MKCIEDSELRAFSIADYNHIAWAAPWKSRLSIVEREGETEHGLPFFAAHVWRVNLAEWRCRFHENFIRRKFHELVEYLLREFISTNASRWLVFKNTLSGCMSCPGVTIFRSFKIKLCFLLIDGRWALKHSSDSAGQKNMHIRVCILSARVYMNVYWAKFIKSVTMGLTGPRQRRYCNT